MVIAILQSLPHKKSKTELTASVLKKKNQKHTKYIKRTLFKWTKQDIMREFSRKSSLSNLRTTQNKQFTHALLEKNKWSFSVVRSFEKEDFLENLHILSCFVQSKSVLFNFCVFLSSFCHSHDVPRVNLLVVRQWRHNCCQFTSLCRSHGVYHVNLGETVTSWLSSVYNLCRRCAVFQVNLLQSDSDVTSVVGYNVSAAAMTSIR